MNEQVKAHATRLSNSGFRVVIPDIYKGKVGVDKEEAAHLMNNLDWYTPCRCILCHVNAADDDHPVCALRVKNLVARCALTRHVPPGTRFPSQDAGY